MSLNGTPRTDLVLCIYLLMILTTPQELGALIATVSHEEMKHREAQQRGYSHTASQRQSWDFSASILAPGSVLSPAIRLSLYLKPPAIPGGQFCYYSPLHEETEALRGTTSGPTYLGTRPV